MHNCGGYNQSAHDFGNHYKNMQSEINNRFVLVRRLDSKKNRHKSAGLGFRVVGAFFWTEFFICSNAVHECFSFPSNTRVDLYIWGQAKRKKNYALSHR